MKITLSERITLCLSAGNVTKGGLAKACGIKPPSVSDWLNGRTKRITGANLLRAAAYLGVTPAWLATGEGPMRLAGGTQVAEPPPPPYYQPPPLEQELMAHVRKMNDRGLILLIDQAEQIAARHPRKKKEAA